MELLKSAKALSPSGMQIIIDTSINEFPNYNPDLDFTDQLPKVVQMFRAEINKADALIIACPEYIHSLPGAFKNALDWIVSGEEIPNKPIAIFNASPTSQFAPIQLEEILNTMSVKIIQEAKLIIPMRAEKLDMEKILSSPIWSGKVQSSITALKSAI